MTQLQEKLLEMLGVFHEFCKENGLSYFALGGTALGAERHKGFIPWDDDVDVGMPRRDYEKLKALVENKQLGDYVFEFPSNKKDFVYAYGKMYDTRTTLVENTRYKTKRGIFLDIFPLDGAGKTLEESKKYFKVVHKKINLLSTKSLAWRKGRKLYKNVAIILMRLFPVNQTKLKQKIDKLSSKIDYDSVNYVANYSGNWAEREISKKQWFGKPRECDFENMKIYAPEMADEYLTAVYGDWKRLPPEEKRVSHHDFLVLDLNKSYLED